MVIFDLLDGICKAQFESGRGKKKKPNCEKDKEK